MSEELDALRSQLGALRSQLTPIDRMYQLHYLDDERDVVPVHHPLAPLLRPICAALRSLGVSRVEMDYNGGGDEGAIESFSFFPEGVVVPDEFQELLDSWVCSVLPGGWEINEGSQGNILINVAESTARIEHEMNFITTESETYEIG
jgi:hypothetical protein